MASLMNTPVDNLTDIQQSLLEPQVIIKYICVRVCVFREILVEESNVQRVDSPVTVSNILSWLLLIENLSKN